MSTHADSPPDSLTVLTLQQKKAAGQPITMLTAYDYPSAQIADRAGLDILLVGDSLGMVVLGYDTTLQVTMDDMLHHCKAVARGSQRALRIGDMPFMSFQTSPADALRNAGRFLAEGGMHAIKLEGGAHLAPTITALVQAGIPVMGHLGLTPQSVNALGGYKAQARSLVDATTLYHDALALQAAGCFAIVLEAVPDRLATLVSRALTIPTLGIGAGPGCDGQVLVWHDVLGLFDRFTPRFVQQYAQLNDAIHTALTQYIADVTERRFPTADHSFKMKSDTYTALLAELGLKE